MDQPLWYYSLVYEAPSHKAMKKLTMQFIGARKVKITAISTIRNSSSDFRKKWLTKVEKLGLANA